MVIVAGTVRVEPDRVGELTDALGALRAATLQQSGCREYTFGFDLEDPYLVRIFEIWETQEDLDAHARSQPVVDWASVAPPLLAGAIDLTIFTATDERPYRI